MGSSFPPLACVVKEFISEPGIKGNAFDPLGECRVFFPRVLIMLIYFLCFGARDTVVMQSVTKFRA